jgi:ATP-dependent RNA helicase RhlE
MNVQAQNLRDGTDVIVATPGRLLDLLQHKTANISNVEYLVIDEADRMFDMGFIRDVQNLIGRVKRERQTLLFSATMSREIAALVASVLRNPFRIVVGQANKPVDTVTHRFYAISGQVKMDLLTHLLRQKEAESVLVFSRTKHGADKIARRLCGGGIQAEAIHSDRSQSQRERALAGFKQGNFRVLVATDIAARGIDIDGITHVFNYDTPAAPEDYIHRIGRTGRAEASGTAVTFVSDDERKYFQRIEQTIGKQCELLQDHGFRSSEGFRSSGGRGRHDYSNADRDGSSRWHGSRRGGQSRFRDRNSFRSVGRNEPIVAY